jgi:hypothetical protein
LESAVATPTESGVFSRPEFADVRFCTLNDYGQDGQPEGVGASKVWRIVVLETTRYLTQRKNAALESFKWGDLLAL